MKIFFIFILMAVIGFWILNHSFTNDRSISLASNPIPTTIIPSPTSTPSPTPTSVILSPVQILRATYGPPLGFDPVEFTIKAGIPARLEVLATENGRGCMGSLMIPDFSTQVEFFEKGKTSIIDFIPTTPGIYYITCAMGIPQATIIVK